MSYKDSERFRKVYSYYRPVPRSTDSGGVSKEYVDEALRAMDWKQSVKYATTGSIVIASNGSAAIDGDDTLTDEDRILVKNQPAAAENGIYMYYAASGLTRTLDATQDALTCGATVYVESGSINEKSIFTLVTQDPITVGTTDQTWMSIIAGGSVPGSPLTSVQFNDGGSFGGDSDFTFNKTTNTLTVTNMSGSLTKLSDGSNYMVGDANIQISTGSNGRVEFELLPSGLDTYVQFNDGDALGSDVNFTYDKSTNVLSVFNGTIFTSELTGSLTKLSDGSSYLVAGPHISIRSASNGSVEISGTVGPGGSNHNVQYNNNGSFGGSDYFSLDIAGDGFAKVYITGSLANGNISEAQGQYSHAEGLSSVAWGTYSYAGGIRTIASGSNSSPQIPQTAVGKYNLRDNTTSLFVVGDGTGDENALRHDVLRVNSGSVEVTGSFLITGSFEVTGSSFLAGDVLEISGSLLVSGTSQFDGDVFITGSSVLAGDTFEMSGSLLVSGSVSIDGSLFVTETILSSGGFSGSLTTLADGSLYLLAGPNITINTNSLGQVEVTGSSSPNYFDSSVVGAIYTSGSAAFVGAGDEWGVVTSPSDKGADVFFYVSGSLGSMGTTTQGVAAFGGDVMITGSLKVGTGSVFITSDGIQVGSSSLQIARAGSDLVFYDEQIKSGVSLSILGGDPRRMSDVSTSRFREMLLSGSAGSAQFITSQGGNVFGDALSLQNSFVGELVYLDLYMSGASGDLAGPTMVATLPMSGTFANWSPRGGNALTVVPMNLLSGAYGAAASDTSIFMCSTGSNMSRVDITALVKSVPIASFATGSYYGGDLSGRIAVLGDYVYGSSPAGNQVVFMATSASWNGDSNSFLLDVGHTFVDGNNPYGLFADQARRRLWVGLTGSNLVSVMSQSSDGTLSSLGTLPIPSVTYMTSDDRYVWALSSGSTMATRIDPDTLQMSSITLSSSPDTYGKFNRRSTAAFDGRHMWMGCGDTVYRVDPIGMTVINSGSVDLTVLPGVESTNWTVGCNPNNGDVYGFAALNLTGGTFAANYGLVLDRKLPARGAVRYKQVTNEEIMTLSDETVIVRSGSIINLPFTAPAGTTFTLRTDGSVFNSGSSGVGSVVVRAEKILIGNGQSVSEIRLTEPQQTTTFMRLSGRYLRMGAASYSMQFDNSHLDVSNQLHVSHSLGNRYNVVQIYNENDFLTGSSILATSENVTTLDFTGQTPLIGVWKVVIR